MSAGPFGTVAAPLEGVRLLSDADIARQLSRLACGKMSRGPGRAPITCICDLLRMSRPTFYKIMRGGRVAERFRPALSIVLQDLERGELEFRREGAQWRPVRRYAPDPLPPPQEKLTPLDAWNEWATCRACGARQWHPVTRSAQTWIACGHCVPSAQYRFLGLEAPRFS